MQATRFGIIGCGNISQAYLSAARRFPCLELAGCADRNVDRAQARAKENGTTAHTVQDLLGRKDIDLVINLTTPLAHAEISLAALRAGKHVHSEKPLATSLADARAILDLAKERGLLVGCAPDTFMGAGLQTCRKVVDEGWIGQVVGGSAFMLAHGMESWHPNPAFFYQQGGGPMLDIGPYYLTALINLLGPVAAVSAMVARTHETRVATTAERFGEVIRVDVPTHQSGVLRFHSGAIVSVTMSYDVHAHNHPPLELWGTLGSLSIPDPNTFDGSVRLMTAAGGGTWKDLPYSHTYADNWRSIGAADLALAIGGRRPHRASGELAYHVLEVGLAFETASVSGQAVTIQSRPERPAPLPLGLAEGNLD